MLDLKVRSKEFVMICTEAEVPQDGAIITRIVKGKTIALARADDKTGKIVAFDSRCPHMQGPLKFGRVVDGEVVCPWHFIRFDTETGATVGCDSIMQLKTFPVDVMGGKIYVQVAE